MVFVELEVGIMVFVAGWRGWRGLSCFCVWNREIGDVGVVLG